MESTWGEHGKEDTVEVIVVFAASIELTPGIRVTHCVCIQPVRWIVVLKRISHLIQVGLEEHEEKCTKLSWAKM